MKRVLVASMIAMAWAIMATQAVGGPYVVQGPFVTPKAGSGIPAPANVPGKEYTDLADKNAFPNHVPSPGQTLLWDGAGGTLNGFNYSATGNEEVDALANLGDALFQEVISDQAALLFSVSGSNNIYYETIKKQVVGVWAMPAQIDQSGVNDLDALEVWGPEGSPDANRYSLFGDPGGSAVLMNGGGTLVTDAQIAAALKISSANDVDLDGLMVFESTNQILFSIRPTGSYDGGEIWVFNYTTGNINFLWHGGHLWDTNFQVATTYGLPSENVNALEAVATPEPATLLLTVLSLFGLGWLRRRHT